MWSVGASCDDLGRVRFDGVVREVLAGPLSEDTRVLHGILSSVEPPAKQLTVPLPSEGSLYQYRFVKEVGGSRCVCNISQNKTNGGDKGDTGPIGDC